MIKTKDKLAERVYINGKLTNAKWTDVKGKWQFITIIIDYINNK